MRARSLVSAFVPALLVLLSPGSRAELVVVGHQPAMNAGNVSPWTDVVVDFDRAVSPGSLPPGGGATFQVFGVNGGTSTGSIALENGGTRLRFTPDDPFFAGEYVRVFLSDGLQAVDSSFLRDAGYTFDFTIRALPATRTFTEIATLDMRDFPFVTVRTYGGQACDLNDDGHIDIAAINEDANDIRVLLNSGDCAGGFTTFMTPTTSVGDVPSPNFAADFNNDGKIDIVTSDVQGHTITIALGDGDGTFSSSTQYASGAEAHGLAVLDANGDGAMDVATANIISDDVSLLLNNGSGVFGAPTTFEGGGWGEWGIAPADFNEDGIGDLVVGCRNTRDVIVHLGNGDGTFVAQTPVFVDGMIWMLVCGDVNGDGHVDVSSANGPTGDGSILLGDGTGGLVVHTTQASGFSSVATDIGDLDGDGDLDWVLSDFGAGAWIVYENDGAGNYSLDQAFPAPNNASCSVLVDIDNDQDLDLFLLDEIADVAVVMENDALAGQVYCDGVSATPCPCGNAGLPCRGCENPAGDGGVQLTASDFTPNGLGGGTVDMLASGFPPNAQPTVLVLRSLTQHHAGMGSVFGDGLLCVAPPVVRVRSSFASGGLATASLMHGAGPGTFHYQAWYRSNPNFCTPDRFNLSNGLTLTWP